jgi:hypothetical protein
MEKGRLAACRPEFFIADCKGAGNLDLHRRSVGDQKSDQEHHDNGGAPDQEIALIHDDLALPALGPAWDDPGPAAFLGGMLSPACILRHRSILQ